MISFWGNIESKLSDNESEDEKEEDSLTIRRLMGRDNGRKSFARFCDTVSLVVYQSAVFLA